MNGHKIATNKLEHENYSEFLVITDLSAETHFGTAAAGEPPLTGCQMKFQKLECPEKCSESCSRGLDVITHEVFSTLMSLY